MTVNNDVCDFCGKWYDAMGNDMNEALLPDGTVWCGHCENGLIFKFRMFNDQALAGRVVEHETFLRESPLNYDHRGDDYQKWGEWLRNKDDLYHAQQEQRRRDGLDDHTKIAYS